MCIRDSPEGHYTHAKARHTGNLWLRHAKRWQRFDAAASAGVSPVSYTHLDVYKRQHRLRGRRTPEFLLSVAVSINTYFSQKQPCAKRLLTMILLLLQLF